MHTYKLTFNNGKKFQVTTETLTEAHDKIVKYMGKNSLIECIIICPNKVTRRVSKTGLFHWNHNGYSFD